VVFVSNSKNNILLSLGSFMPSENNKQAFLGDTKHPWH
jgi:hypothetical protein